jgi:soluble lytic murein transglycosylase
MERLFAIVLLLSLFVPHPGKAEETAARLLFQRAYSLYTNNQLTEAEALFLKTVDVDDTLVDYSLYFLGQIAFSQASFAAARSYLSRLKENFADSVWLAAADLLLAKISLAEHDYTQSTRSLQTLANLEGRSEIACEARYLFGQIQELQGQGPQAHETYQQLRRTFPRCTWADAARKALQQLRQQHPQLSPDLSYQTLSEEGELLLAQRQQREAEAAFQKLLRLFPDEGLRPRSLMGLVRVYDAARRREEQIPLLAVIANKYPRSPEAPAALARLAMIYWNRNENLKALANFKRLVDGYPTSPHADTATIALARIYQSLGQTQQAISVLRAFPRNFPASSQRAEAHWRLAWIYYTQADFKPAHAAFRDLAEGADSGRYKTGALYWQARSAEKIGRQQEAQKIYLAIVQNDGESFYAGSAQRRLGAATGADARPVVAPVSYDPPVSARANFHLARARVLAELSLNSLALVELDEIKNELADPGSRFLMMREYARIGAYQRSIAIASQIPVDSDAVKLHRYPLAYWDLVQQKAKETGLDPYLILALIRQESLFDTHAVSPAHAFGLMQLVPTTAARLAKELGLPQPTPEKLFDPELNLTLGTFYLRELLRLYANDPVKALAAYNAGENAAARWESQILTDDPDEFIERITYRETLQYVKFVLRGQRLYRALYADQK